MLTLSSVAPRMHTVPNEMFDTKAEMNRSIAQPGSAPGLGPGGRRFESYCSDHLKEYFKIGEVSHDKHHRLSACSSVG